jgi:hypothetical protein
MRVTLYQLKQAIKLFCKTYLQSIIVRSKAPKTKIILSLSQLRSQNQSGNRNPLPTPNTSSKHQPQ